MAVQVARKHRIGMTKTWERATAAVLAGLAGLGTALDVFHVVTFQGRGSPDIAFILLLVVFAALHLGLAGANAGLAAMLSRRTPQGAARVAVWCWLVLSLVLTLSLSLFGQLLAT